ncbi:MAG TPA: DUF4136 domain-containing protein [Steroidobacteraceae bacterium]|jgi:hypothetical protein
MHQSRLLPASILCFATLLLQACATDPIETSGDVAKLPPFRTFSVGEEQYSFPSPPSEAQRARISKELRGAAVAALESRGYREATPGDVEITLGAISRPTFSDASDPEERAHITHVDTSVLSPGSDSRPSSDRDVLPEGGGREGDLILYVLDPATKRVIWRASASGSATTPKEALSKAKATYRAMASQLPAVAD